MKSVIMISDQTDEIAKSDTHFPALGKSEIQTALRGISMTELLKAIWDFDNWCCKACGCLQMVHLGMAYVPVNFHTFPSYFHLFGL